MMRSAARKYCTYAAVEGIAESYQKVGLQRPEVPAALPKKVQTGLFINGEFVKSLHKTKFQTVDPATTQVICEVEEAGPEDVNAAVAAAQAAMKGEWGKTGGYTRGRLLSALADKMEENAAQLAALESLDNGKTYGEAMAADLPLAVACLRYYGGWADKCLTGHHNELSGPGTGFGGFHTHFGYTRHEPLGAVGQIIPWNFPILMLAWKLGPALACGCSVVLKTAEQTPLSALRIAELVQEVGFPKGSVNILSGFGDKTTDGKEGPGVTISRHQDLTKVAFTGSTEVGQTIMKHAAETNLKRVTLELGGKSPNIVFADSNLDAAIAGAHLGLFLNQGQCCCAGSRLFVEDKIYDQFVQKCIDAAKARVVGGAFTPGAAQGPQVSQEQFEKVTALIKSGKDQGATCATGGGTPSTVAGPGYFVEPTVFTDVKPNMDIWNQEIFGPVMCIQKFSDMDDLIERANDTHYGLAAAVWSNDTNKIQHLVTNLKAGTVWVNCYDVFDNGACFGGYKMSGIGRELSEYALRNYTEIKQVTQALSKTW